MAARGSLPEPKIMTHAQYFDTLTRGVETMREVERALICRPAVHVRKSYRDPLSTAETERKLASLSRPDHPLNYRQTRKLDAVLGRNGSAGEIAHYMLNTFPIASDQLPGLSPSELAALNVTAEEEFVLKKLQYLHEPHREQIRKIQRRYAAFEECMQDGISPEHWTMPSPVAEEDFEPITGGYVPFAGSIANRRPTRAGPSSAPRQTPVDPYNDPPLPFPSGYTSRNPAYNKVPYYGIRRRSSADEEMALAVEAEDEEDGEDEEDDDDEQRPRKRPSADISDAESERSEPPRKRTRAATRQRARQQAEPVREGQNAPALEDDDEPATSGAGADEVGRRAFETAYLLRRSCAFKQLEEQEADKAAEAAAATAAANAATTPEEAAGIGPLPLPDDKPTPPPPGPVATRKTIVTTPPPDDAPIDLPGHLPLEPASRQLRSGGEASDALIAMAQRTLSAAQPDMTLALRTDVARAMTARMHAAQPELAGGAATARAVDIADLFALWGVRVVVVGSVQAALNFPAETASRLRVRRGAPRYK